MEAPEVELKALEDTLGNDGDRCAGLDGERARAANDVLRVAPSAAEAELDALAPTTSGSGAAPGSAYAFARDGGRSGDVPAAEAELHALLAWEDESARAAGPIPRAPLASGAHDDAGTSAAGDSRPSVPERTRPGGEEPKRTSAERGRDVHAAATDDCTCT